MNSKDKVKTGIFDVDGSEIQTGDSVSMFGMTGEVVFWCGAYGIGFEQAIDWERVKKEIPSIAGCDSEPRFCYNNDFVSFLELILNFDCEDSWCDVVKIIGDECNKA